MGTSSSVAWLETRLEPSWHLDNFLLSSSEASPILSARTIGISRWSDYLSLCIYDPTWAQVPANKFCLSQIFSQCSCCHCVFSPQHETFCLSLTHHMLSHPRGPKKRFNKPVGASHQGPSLRIRTAHTGDKHNIFAPSKNSPAFYGPEINDRITPKQSMFSEFAYLHLD